MMWRMQGRRSRYGGFQPDSVRVRDKSCLHEDKHLVEETGEPRFSGSGTEFRSTFLPVSVKEMAVIVDREGRRLCTIVRLPRHRFAHLEDAKILPVRRVTFDVEPRSAQACYPRDLLEVSRCGVGGPRHSGVAVPIQVDVEGPRAVRV